MGARSNTLNSALFLRGSAVLLAVLLAASVAPAQRPAPCRSEIIEGDVHAGELFERPIGNGLRLVLEPLPSGWILRVLPLNGQRGAQDYAELATPPYRSVSPLLISTDFSFRAQDALAWNPRHFHFAAGRASFAELQRAYDEAGYGDFDKSAGSSPAQRASSPSQRAAEARLAQLAAQTPSGDLTLLDAHVVQGTADQAGTAAMVASHLNSSAHEVDQPADGRSTPLGRLNWVRFRIRLDLPSGFQAPPGVAVKRGKCS